MVRRVLWPLLGLSSAMLTIVNFVVGGDEWSLSFLGFGIVGAFVAWKVPEHVTGPLMIGLSGVSALTSSEALKEAIPATEWVGASMPLLMGLFVLTFPGGRIRGWRRPVVVGASLMTLAGVVVVARTGDEGPYLTAPLIVFVLIAMLDLFVRFRAADGEQAAQMKLVVFATVLIPPVLLVPALANVPDPIYDFFVITGFTLVPVAVGAAIIRYRLYDIDRIISRTLTYAIVAALLAGTYAAAVWIITSLLPLQSSLAVAASTLAVATAFNPLRKRVQRIIDIRFNRSSYQAQLVAEQFASKLIGPHTMDELIERWIHTIDQTLQPQARGVWLAAETPRRIPNAPSGIVSGSG